MKLINFIKYWVLQFFTNIYGVILTAFIIWMLFFDGNSFLYHNQLNKEINKLVDWNSYHRKKIREDKKMIEKLNNPEELERYARERYLMRKKNEDIYIIEFDTIQD